MRRCDVVSSWSEYKCHEDISSKKPTYFSFKKEATKISGYSYLKKRQSTFFMHTKEKTRIYHNKKWKG